MGAANWPSGFFHLIVVVCVQHEDGAALLTQRAANKEFSFGGSSQAEALQMVRQVVRRRVENCGNSNRPITWWLQPGLGWGSVVRGGGSDDPGLELQE